METKICDALLGSGSNFGVVGGGGISVLIGVGLRCSREGHFVDIFEVMAGSE